ncbi:hypothetical protein ES705_47068 [subsurface metagenome]
MMIGFVFPIASINGILEKRSSRCDLFKILSSEAKEAKVITIICGYCSSIKLVTLFNRLLLYSKNLGVKP